jgi:hypothetical protein
MEGIELTKPTLPFELICIIFTMAAMGEISSAVVLCRVSTAFHELITPLLYRTVALSSPRQINKFCSRSSDKSTKYWVLKVGSQYESDFRKCVNVDHLALCTPYSCKNLKDLRPKYVHFGVKEDPSLYRPDYEFFTKTTHMRLWYVLVRP